MSVLKKGLYDQIVTATLRQELARLPESLRAVVESLSREESIEYLSRHVADQVRRALKAQLDAAPDQDLVDSTNHILAAAGASETVEAAVLQAVTDAVATRTPAPLIPLAQSALVTNDQGSTIIHSFDPNCQHPIAWT